MNLTQAARVLNINPRTLRLAVERGQIEARHPLPDGPWVINRRDYKPQPPRTSFSAANKALSFEPRRRAEYVCKALKLEFGAWTKNS
jgi:hypothetical protein